MIPERRLNGSSWSRLRVQHLPGDELGSRRSDESSRGHGVRRSLEATARPRSTRAVRGGLTLGTALVVALAAPPAHAGAKLQLGEDSQLDFGFVAQVEGLLAREDADTTPGVELAPRVVVRRARLRLNAQVTRWFSAFLQTDRGDGDGRLGVDYRLIDAHVVVAPAKELRLYAGELMAPSSRQNLTSSYALLAFDRPGMAFKSLTWGTRALAQFGNRAMDNTDAGLRSSVPVRDIGWTAFGAIDVARDAHVKYYAGTYEGVQTAGHHAVRIDGRVQVNFFDPEPDYFNASTYLGTRRTIGLGVSYDTQPHVANDAFIGAVGYRFVSADAFVELPTSRGSFTFETGYSSLDLGHATQADSDGNPATPPRDLRRAEGRGAYAQAAFATSVVQPWVAYEVWDARTYDGSYRLGRFGFNKYIDGQHANVKVAYEHALGEGTLGKGLEHSWGTLALGVFLYY